MEAKKEAKGAVKLDRLASNGGVSDEVAGSAALPPPDPKIAKMLGALPGTEGIWRHPLERARGLPCCDELVGLFGGDVADNIMKWMRGDERELVLPQGWGEGGCGTFEEFCDTIAPLLGYEFSPSGQGRKGPQL